MPSETKHEIKVVEDVACLMVSSNDPRRSGRVDAVLFDSKYVNVVSSFSKWFGSGTNLYNENGTLFSAVISNLVGMHTRIAENDDFRAINFTKREFNQEYAKSAAIMRKMAWIESTKQLHDKIKWKTKYDVVELPIIIQNNEVLTIKINAFMAHLVPKYGYFLPKNCPNGVCFRAENPTSKSPHGRSLAKKIYDFLGRPSSGKAISRYDVHDFSVDPVDNCFNSTKTTRNIWHEYGDEAVLEIRINDSNVMWYPTDAKYQYPSFCDMDNERKVVFVVFDSCVLEALRNKECDWTYTKTNNTDNMDVTALYTDTSSIKLKRVLAELYGFNIGMQTIPSRYNKYYQRAIETGNYKARVKFENRTNDEKHGSTILFTRAINKQYLSVRATKEYFADWLYDGIGAWCLDMRKQSLLVGGQQ